MNDGGCTFYLGAMDACWLRRTAEPLMLSRNRLRRVLPKSWPRANGPWLLDSGAFTELHAHGRWTVGADEYAATVADAADRIGGMVWAAPQDWMCEPFMLARTGLTVADHLRLTVENFAQLRDLLGPLVIPVLQGYGPRDYERCIDLYTAAGFDLTAEPVVGLGSVCKRSRTQEAVRLVRYLARHGIRFHGFGLKGRAVPALAGLLASADSFAWSYHARKNGGDPNSLTTALAWRARTLGEAVAVA